MFKQVEKKHSNKKITVNAALQKRSANKYRLELLDNRSDFIAQRKRMYETGEVNSAMPVQRLEIANIASGTDSSTLMHSRKKDDKIINIDTGHMVLSDEIIRANNPDVWGVIANEFIRLELKTSMPGEKKLGAKTKEQWLSEQMSKGPAFAAARLKQVLGAKSGMKGAYEIYHLLPEFLKYEIVMKLQSLSDFRLGDLGGFAEQSVKKGGTDVVHIVNALGFDPINDLVQAKHLATGIKLGGELIITAEASGQSVSSLIPHALTKSENAVEDIKGFLDKTAKERLGQLALGKYFILSKFIVGNKDTVMSNNEYTEGLNTRHTIASGASTSMEDNIPTVQLTFIRNDYSESGLI